MITALGLFQFGVISLAIMTLKILVHAHGGYVPEFPAELDAHGLWLYLVPLVWAGLATAALRSKQQKVAYAVSGTVGALLVVAVIVFYGVAVAEVVRINP